VVQSSVVSRRSSLRAGARTQVALLGWYGSDNTGDEAVLEAIVSTLRSRGITDLHAFSINPAKTASRLGVGSSPRKLFNLTTLRALRSSRALILGGGGLIQDRTSVYNLPIYALYVMVARLFGLKVIGWGLGVEPLDTLLGKLLARYICTSATYFSVRDEGAKRLLVKAGVPPERITVTADPAFLIEPHERPARQPGEQPVVVFCLRDLPDNRPGLNLHYLLPISVRRKLGLGRDGNERRTAGFVESLARGVRVCVQEFGARVEFVALWPGRDDQMADAVMREAERLGVPGHIMRRIEVEPVASEVAGVVGRADLVVSMRLHALIFGALAGAPVLALAYARKMRGLMRLLGSERWVVEVETRTPPAEEIEMKLRLLWSARSMQGEKNKAAAARAGVRTLLDVWTIPKLLEATRLPDNEAGPSNPFAGHVGELTNEANDRFEAGDYSSAYELYREVAMLAPPPSELIGSAENAKERMRQADEEGEHPVTED
jgi:polysaccharide pyruvyl transferase WcaK-like protein